MKFILLWLLIGVILFLLFAVVRFLYRGRYAESIRTSLLKAPEANRERFLKYEQKMLMRLKISLLPFLILLILLSLATFLLFREYFFAITVDMVLSFILILHEYSFRKWLINYLEVREIQK